MGKKKSSIREPNPEEIAAQKRAMDERELRRLVREAGQIKDAKVIMASAEKQTKVRDILASEKKNLINHLNLIKSRSICTKDFLQSENVNVLFSEGDDLDSQIALEKKYIKDLEAQISSAAHQYELAKKEQKGHIVTTSDYNQKEKNMKEAQTLESCKSKLHAVQLQLGVETQKNAELRQKIKIMLQEKAKFNTRYEELMEKLKRGKAMMTDLVERSKVQFQRRDEIARKILALKQRDQKDLRIKSEEMQELEMKVSEDYALAQYKFKAQQVRVYRAASGTRGRGKSFRMEAEKIINRIVKLKYVIEKVQEIMELEEVKDICEKINSDDKIIFSLFCFNNEIRDQLEVVMQKTADTVRRVDEEQALAELEREKHVQTLNFMNAKMSSLQQKNSNLHESFESNARVFDRLLSKLRTLFDVMGCDPAPLALLLGNNKEVTTFNYRLFLCLVETRLIEVLDVYAPLGQGEGKAAVRASTTTTIATLQPSRMFKPKTVSNYSMRTNDTEIMLPMVVTEKVITAPCPECTTRRSLPRTTAVYERPQTIAFL